MDRIIAHFRAYNRLPSLSRIDVLDGVRALCVFLVGWFHIWQQGWLTPHFMIGNRFISLDFLLRSGYLWVDGMLLLSGFLLYLPYTQARSELPKALPFYKRRLIRILPSYLLAVAFFFALSCLENKYGNLSNALKDLGAHLTFTHTFFYFSYLGSPINGVLWTLAVEMQFYLLFPLLARCFHKKPVLTYLGMAAIAFGYRYYVGATKPDTSMWFNQLPADADGPSPGWVPKL